MIHPSMFDGYGRSVQLAPALAVFTTPDAIDFFLFPTFISMKEISASVLRGSGALHIAWSA
jgi:hypothetical protein